MHPRFFRGIIFPVALSAQFDRLPETEALLLKNTIIIVVMTLVYRQITAVKSNSTNYMTRQPMFDSGHSLTLSARAL